MHRDGWIVLGVGVLAWIWFEKNAQSHGSTLPVGLNPLGDLFGGRAPATPPATDTGNGGATGTYGPPMENGQLYTTPPTGGKMTASDTVDENGPIYSPPNRQVVF
jgi:hypothetical protein